VDEELAAAKQDFEDLYNFLQLVLACHGFTEALALMQRQVQANAMVWEGTAKTQTKFWVMKETAWATLARDFPEAQRIAEEYLRTLLGPDKAAAADLVVKLAQAYGGGATGQPLCSEHGG
jgi:hypothetical protein